MKSTQDRVQCLCAYCVHLKNTFIQFCVAAKKKRENANYWQSTKLQTPHTFFSFFCWAFCISTAESAPFIWMCTLCCLFFYHRFFSFVFFEYKFQLCLLSAHAVAKRMKFFTTRSCNIVSVHLCTVQNRDLIYFISFWMASRCVWMPIWASYMHQQKIRYFILLTIGNLFHRCTFLASNSVCATRKICNLYRWELISALLCNLRIAIRLTAFQFCAILLEKEISATEIPTEE